MTLGAAPLSHHLGKAYLREKSKAVGLNLNIQSVCVNIQVVCRVYFIVHVTRGS